MTYFNPSIADGVQASNELNDNLEAQHPTATNEDTTDATQGRIFGNWSIADQARNEWTCKRWPQAGRTIWPKRAKQLIFGYDTGSLLETESDPIERMKMLREILQAHGKQLRRVSFAGHWFYKSTTDTIKVIAEMCPELEELDMGNLHTSCDDLSHIWQNCYSLRSLTIGHCNGRVDDFLDLIIRRNPNLTKISIAASPDFDGAALNSLRPNSLRCLVVQKYTSFSFLKLSYNRFEHSLTELIVRPYFQEDIGIYYITRLVNLRVLCLHAVTFTDMNFIKSVAENCQKLVVLDLKLNFKGAFDKELQPLMTLRRLRYLALRGVMNFVTHNVFSKYPVTDLRTLVMPHGEFWLLYDHSRVAKCFPALETYRICDCTGVCDSILKSLVGTQRCLAFNITK